MLLAPSATNRDSILRHSNEVGVGVLNIVGAVVGGEDTVIAIVNDLSDAGVADFAPSEFTLSAEARVRTRCLLKSLQK